MEKAFVDETQLYKSFTCRQSRTFVLSASKVNAIDVGGAGL
jgi:hypothetical protein